MRLGNAGTDRVLLSETEGWLSLCTVFRDLIQKGEVECGLVLLGEAL